MYVVFFVNVETCSLLPFSLVLHIVSLRFPCISSYLVSLLFKSPFPSFYFMSYFLSIEILLPFISVFSLLFFHSLSFLVDFVHPPTFFCPFPLAFFHLRSFLLCESLTFLRLCFLLTPPFPLLAALVTFLRFPNYPMSST